MDLSNKDLSACDLSRITISWHNINVHVKSKKKYSQFKKATIEQPKCILRNLNGEVQPGQVLAIMGASGAGKTSLLNVLTNRNLRTFDVTGKVRLNGYDAEDEVTRYSAYVQQHDLFHPSLTVREHLIFQAMLRMDAHLNTAERMAELQRIISELSLTDCVNTRIGQLGLKVGISGGESKRLAIASELLTNPPILFCDEPTSGLDSCTSKSVIMILKKLAEGGKTIIFTIHQPASEIFDMFDNILLMAEGRVAYMGSKSGAINFFQSVNLYIPVNYNPADFFISQLAVVPGKEEECRKRINSICDSYGESRQPYENSDDTKKERSLNSLNLPQVPRCKASWLTQMRMHVWQNYLRYKREPSLIIFQIISTMCISLLLGCFYYGQKLDQRGIMNINGGIFMLMVQNCYRTFFSSIHAGSNLGIFFREYHNGIYGSDTYFLSRTVFEFPVLTTAVIINTSIFYWMAGMKPEVNAYLLCMVVIALTALTSHSCGYAVAYGSNSVPLALAIGAAILFPLLILGGYFLNTSSINYYFLWIKYFSWYSYGYEFLVVNQWNGIQNISCAVDLRPKESCILDGKGVIASLDFDADAMYGDILKLLALCLGYRTLAYAFLYWKCYRKT